MALPFMIAGAIIGGGSSILSIFGSRSEKRRQRAAIRKQIAVTNQQFALASKQTNMAASEAALTDLLADQSLTGKLVVSLAESGLTGTSTAYRLVNASTMAYQRSVSLGQANRVQTLEQLEIQRQATISGLEAGMPSPSNPFADILQIGAGAMQGATLGKGLDK